MPGCWSWPPICASSTNRRTRSGLSRWLLEQDLDGQVAAEVGVAALEHGPHAAAGDLAEELEPHERSARSGISAEAGRTTARVARRVGVAEQDLRQPPRLSARREKRAGACRADRHGHLVRVLAGRLEPRPQQAGRAEPPGASAGRSAAAPATCLVVHRRPPQVWIAPLSP